MTEDIATCGVQYDTTNYKHSESNKGIPVIVIGVKKIENASWLKHAGEVMRTTLAFVPITEISEQIDALEQAPVSSKVVSHVIRMNTTGGH